MYSLIIDVGEKLRTVSDPKTSAFLQEELSQLQQSWGDTQAQLEKKKMQLSSTVQVDDALREQQHLLLWHWVYRASLPHHSQCWALYQQGKCWAAACCRGLGGKCLSSAIRACGKLQLWSPVSPKECGAGIQLLLQWMFPLWLSSCSPWRGAPLLLRAVKPELKFSLEGVNMICCSSCCCTSKEKGRLYLFP